MEINPFPLKLQQAIRKKAAQIGEISAKDEISAAEVVDHYDISINEDQDTRDESEKRLFYRICLCCLAILLIWLTSLDVSLGLVNYTITTPTYLQVQDTCTYSYNVIEEENRIYQECTTNQLNLCSSELSKASIAEQNRILNVATNNQQRYDLFTMTARNCSIQYDNVKQAIKTWSQGDTYHNIPYSSQCTADDIAATKLSLGRQSTSLDNLYTASIEYSYNQQANSDSFVEYIFKLQNYNDEYVANKSIEAQNINLSLNNITQIFDTSSLSINNSIGELVGCLGMSNSDKYQCPLNNSAFGIYTFSTAAANIQYDILTRFSQKFARSLESLTTRASELFSLIEDFQNSVLSLSQWVEITYQQSNDALCLVTSPSWCQYTSNVWYLVDVGFPAFPAITRPEEPDQIWESTNSIVPLVEKQIGDIFRDAANSVEDITMGFTLDDYDPPQYNVDLNLKISNQKQESQEFRDKIEHYYSNTDQSNNTVTDMRGRNITSFLTSLPYSKLSLSWIPLSLSEFDFNLVILTFTNLHNVLYYLDIVYRILCTVHIIYRYWSKSIVNLPIIDIRQKKDHIDKQSWRELQLIGRFMSVLWLQLATLIIAVVVIITMLSGLFLLEFNIYTAGCVKHTQEHTVISKTLNSAAFNFAAYDGNKIVTSGIQAYNIDSNHECTSARTTSQAKYTDLVNNFISTNTSYQSIAANFEVTKRCLNTTKLDHDFIDACCDNAEYQSFVDAEYISRVGCQPSNQCPIKNALYNIPYQPVSQYLGETDCRANESIINIENSMYDCGNLPSCVLSCHGPRPGIVYAVTKACSCMTEWYFNSNVLKTLFAVLVFIILNISRIFICKGMIRIFWKYLVEMIFEYKGNCNIDGDIITGSNQEYNKYMSSSYESVENDLPKEKLKAQIALEIRRFEWKGYMLLFVGIAINCLWIVLLITFTKDLVYQPS